ncbi:MAG: hypothetical protein ABIG96_01940, partial [Candidatus Micrarchaeota archaeon]
TFSSYVSFAITYLLGRLDETSLLAAIFLNLMIAGSSIRKFGYKLEKKELKIGKVGGVEAAVVGIFLMLAYFNSMSLAEDADGNIWSISNAWADYAFHVSIINSFALRDNIPPIYPNLAEAPMRYPFMVDYLSAIMVKEGVPITYSITIPNLLIIFSLVVLSYSFMRKFFSSRQIAALAIVLFFLNGNYGFLQFFDHYNSAPDKMAFMMKLPKAYSYLPDEGTNIQFMNLSYSVFIPQRAALMGFPLACLVLIIMLRIFKGEAENKEFFLAGLITAMLPMVHASSFAIAGFIGVCVFGMTIVRRQKIDSRWMVYAIPLIVFALPQLLFIDQQERRTDFFGPQIGWMSRATDYQGFISFWFENAGLVLGLGVLGLMFLKREQAAFVLPFFAIFVACNLLRFQPWEWDNVKLLMYWYFIMAGLAAAYLAKLYDSAKRGAKAVGTLIVAMLILISIFSGALTMIAWNSSSAVLWTKEDVRIAEFINENTEKDAVFATFGSHNNPVYTLGGRQILVGYDGHLWSHGLYYNLQSNDARKIFESGDRDVIRRWNIGYIYLGREEIARWGASASVFSTSWDYEEIYENRPAGVKIFRVNGNP